MHMIAFAIQGNGYSRFSVMFENVSLVRFGIHSKKIHSSFVFSRSAVTLQSRKYVKGHERQTTQNKVDLFLRSLTVKNPFCAPKAS